MNLNKKYIFLLIYLILIPSAKSAENLILYRGTFSRTIKIEELYKFKKSNIQSNKLKSLIKMTNQNYKELHKVLSYEIDMPLKASSKLMNSKIGEIFLNRISRVIYPNKISDKNIRIKALRSGIILSSYKNHQKINLINFFKAYPNKNIAINLNELGKALTKVDSLKELIEFYLDSPLKKLKDGSSSI